jgi:tetratricopeptide (TPR) repeat protein
MRALISGQAGIAVLIDGEACSSIEVHSSGWVPRAASDVAYLLGDAGDLVELDGTTKDEVTRELETAWLKDRSLHLALIALDREAASENRRSAVECLSDLLMDSPVTDFVRNRLYAAPLPASADLSGALEVAVSSGSTRFAVVLEGVRTDQELIRRNRLAWDALRPDLFGGAAEKERFGFAAVESGMFRLLAQGKHDDALAGFHRFARDHRTGVKWDVRRLAKRWQRINALIAKEPPTRRPAALAHEPAGLRRLPPAVARTARAAGAFVSHHQVLTAVACVLLAAIIVSTFLTPVSAKNATALTPPGTGGIMATNSLLRSELPLTLRSATARSHFDEAEKALSVGKFAEAARLYEMSGKAVDTLAAKLNFGIAVYNSSDLPKAASIFSAGLQIARKEHVAILEGAFLTNLGNVSREQGHLDEAARLYRAAEEIDRGIDELGSATTAYNSGVLYEMRGNFSESLSQFNIARQGYRHLGNKLGEAGTLVRRAGLLRIILEAESDESEDLRAAAQLYQKIPGPLAEASYHFAVGNRELDEGFDHRDKASIGRAVEEFKRAYSTYESIGYRQGQAVAMCSLGNAYHEQSNSLDATVSYGECLSTAVEIGSPFLQAIAYSSGGRQDIASGKPSEGLEQLTFASQVAQKMGARGVEVTVLEEIGSEYARRGELELALSYHEKAVKTAESSGDPYLLIQAVRAPDYKPLGDASKTIAALVRLRDLYAAVGNTARSAEVQREIDQFRK